MRNPSLESRSDCQETHFWGKRSVAGRGNNVEKSESKAERTCKLEVLTLEEGGREAR